jgi:hypothetical protein
MLTEQALRGLWLSSQWWLNTIEGTAAFLSPVPGTEWVVGGWPQHFGNLLKKFFLNLQVKIM